MRKNVRSILCVFSSVAAVLFAALPLRGEEVATPSEAQQKQITELIEQLKSEEFKTREAAIAKLAVMGSVTKPALTATINDPDLEVRLRVQRLLTAVLAEEYRRQLQEFAEDTEDVRQLDLPGWSKFKAAFGAKGEARNLFVSMQREEGVFLWQVAQNPKKAGEMLNQRYAEIKFKNLTSPPGLSRPFLSLGTVATLLFVASEPDTRLDDKKFDDYLGSWIANMTRQPNYFQALNEGQEIPRQIVKRWLAHPHGQKSILAAQTNLEVALQLKYREGLIPAFQILGNDAAAPLFRQMAIMVIGLHGDKEHVARLTPFLEDTTKCINFGSPKTPGPTDIQTRDLALVAMIHLAGQDPKEFGYEFLQPSEQLLYQVGTVGFKDSEKRDAALKKWSLWSAEHLK